MSPNDLFLLCFNWKHTFLPTDGLKKEWTFLF